MRQRTKAEIKKAVDYSEKNMLDGLAVEAKTELGQKKLRQALSELHNTVMFLAYGTVETTQYDKDVIEAMKGNTPQTQNKAR